MHGAEKLIVAQLIKDLPLSWHSSVQYRAYIPSVNLTANKQVLVARNLAAKSLLN